MYEPMWAKIRERVDASGIKYKYIATKLGSSPAKLSLMLSGQRRISIEDFVEICSAIGASPTEFFDQQQPA